MSPANSANRRASRSQRGSRAANTRLRLARQGQDASQSNGQSQRQSQDRAARAQSAADLRALSDQYGKYSPPRAGRRAGESGSSAGMLEAEFVICCLLILLWLFTNTQDSYADKMLSVMKRLFLTGFMFFILALASEIGPGTAKVCKAFGGLVTVAILLSTANGSVISTLDQFFKADWIANDNSASSGNVSDSTSSVPALQQAENAAKTALATEGQKGASDIGNVVSTAAGNDAVSVLNGIIPGLGTGLGKILGF